MADTLTKESLAELIGELKSRSKPFDWPVLDSLKDLALEALAMRPHVAQFGEGKLEVILGELECEGNVYIVPAKHQGKVGEITPPELRAARDQWHDGEIVLRFPNQLQALLVAAALTNVKPEDWVFEESQSPLFITPKGENMTWLFNRILCLVTKHHWEDLPCQKTGDVIHWHKCCYRCGRYRSGHYISPSDV